MALPDRPESSSPPWRRAEAALPWTDVETLNPEPTPEPDAAAAALVPAPPDTTEPEEDHSPRQLHPLPRGLVELYGLLAVLFVLVPEWMASGALFGFREGRQGSELPAPSGAWKRLPELRLASLNLAELRQLAQERRLIGYSRQGRQELTARLLPRLKARP